MPALNRNPGLVWRRPADRYADTSELLARYPTDLIALKAANHLHFYRGMLRERASLASIA